MSLQTVRHVPVERRGGGGEHLHPAPRTGLYSELPNAGRHHCGLYYTAVDAYCTGMHGCSTDGA